MVSWSSDWATDMSSRPSSQGEWVPVSDKLNQNNQGLYFPLQLLKDFLHARVHSFCLGHIPLKMAALVRWPLFFFFFASSALNGSCLHYIFHVLTIQTYGVVTASPSVHLMVLELPPYVSFFFTPFHVTTLHSQPLRAEWVPHSVLGMVCSEIKLTERKGWSLNNFVRAQLQILALRVRVFLCMQVYIFMCVYLYVSHWLWHLPIRLVWLAREPQCSISASPGITSAYNHTQFFSWVSGAQTAVHACLSRASLTNPSPIPYAYF